MSGKRAPPKRDEEDDELERQVREGLAKGYFEIASNDPDTGLPRYRLTKKGDEIAERALLGQGPDGDAGAAYLHSMFWNLAIADLEKTNNIWRFARAVLKHGKSYPFFEGMIGYLAEETKDEILKHENWRINLEPSGEQGGSS